VNPPAVYLGYTVHVRHRPILRAFRKRLYLWLVDLDELPVLSWWARPFARFRAVDHLGSPDRSLRDNVDCWLGTQGIDLDGGQVLMLASARVLGYVFNPLSVFWCHLADGRLACVIAEVSNTYGERHCYLLPAGPAGESEVEKSFYVSPFLEVAGRYRMRLPQPDERLSLSIELIDDGRPLLTAVLRGRRASASSRDVLRLALTKPLMPHRISVAIRRHGIALWLRRLPVVPRPPHHPPEASR